MMYDRNRSMSSWLPRRGWGVSLAINRDSRWATGSSKLTSKRLVEVGMGGDSLCVVVGRSSSLSPSSFAGIVRVRHSSGLFGHWFRPRFACPDQGQRIRRVAALLATQVFVADRLHQLHGAGQRA